MLGNAKGVFVAAMEAGGLPADQVWPCGVVQYRVPRLHHFGVYTRSEAYFVVPFLEETKGTLCSVNQNLVGVRSGRGLLAEMIFGTIFKGVYCYIPRNVFVTDCRCDYCRNSGFGSLSVILSCSGVSGIFLVHNCTF